MLKSLSWCTHIEQGAPTLSIHKLQAKSLLLASTKNQLMNACQWLDQNLGPLFTKHFPKNTWFHELSDGMIPRWLDKIVTSEATENYAKKLMTTIPALPDNAKK